jgi:hypothetical protein
MGYKCVICNQPKARYNNLGQKPAYCNNCRQDGMIDCTSKMCIVCKMKQKRYGYVGGKATHCSSCVLENMQAMNVPKCIVCGLSQPAYAHPGQKPQHCGKCALEGMKDVRNPECVVCKKTRASYGYVGQKQTHCAKCALENMQEIRSKKCAVCKKSRVSYGYIGKKPTHCAKCALPNMEDIKHHRCIICNKTRATYAYAGKKPDYCVKCALPKMVDVVSTKCKKCGLKRANYGYLGGKVQFCAKCALPGMKYLKAKICKSEWCDTTVQNTSKKYEGYCTFCFRNLFPDRPVTKNFRTKERDVVEYIKSNFTNIDIICDKIIQCGCSRRRSDIYIDLGYQVIIVEIDENQHIDYDCSCENKRIMELSQDVNHRPIIFIRFNPDDYKTNSGNVTSCWALSKAGKCSVKKCKKKEWAQRLQTLKENVEYWLNPENVSDKTVQIIQLYYDTIIEQDDVQSDTSSEADDSDNDIEYDDIYPDIEAIIPTSTIIEYPPLPETNEVLDINLGTSNILSHITATPSNSTSTPVISDDIIENI